MRKCVYIQTYCYFSLQASAFYFSLQSNAFYFSLQSNAFYSTISNISDTAKLMGLLPLYIGMEMILTESILPPRYVRGTACQVVGIELHPKEPSIKDRESIATQGSVLLRFMPKCVYVRVENSTHVFLQSSPWIRSSAR